MFLAARDSRRGVVRPAIVLAGVADVRSDLGILLHPAPPIGFQERAKFLRGGRLRSIGFRGAGLGSAGRRASAWLPRIFGAAKRELREGKSCAGNRHSEHHEHANHYGFLPAAVANSLSRSRASITMRRAVSAASIAVLSMRTASAARTSAETLRSRSRLSRSRTSPRTCAGVIDSPFS